MTIRKRSLAHGRPPGITRSSTSLSSQATRSIIRSHHQLKKAHAQAVSQDDHARVAEIESRILTQGGLKAYQAASLAGQSLMRGGDSSKVLVEWLDGLLEPSLVAVTRSCADTKYKMLEVGAVSTKNACSRSQLLHVTRIDLHAQERGIQRQDFMQMKLQRDESEKFDVISLSLVLNYVPNAKARGEMLRRTCDILRVTNGHADDMHVKRLAGCSKLFPCLFLVLPAPCITNSRFLTQERLVEIMASLGYELMAGKLSLKMAYSLWHLDDSDRRAHRNRSFPKTEVNPGKIRNNFAITLD